jgi:hypothetical protein
VAAEQAGCDVVVAGAPDRWSHRPGGNGADPQIVDAVSIRWWRRATSWTARPRRSLAFGARGVWMHALHRLAWARAGEGLQGNSPLTRDEDAVTRCSQTNRCA